ncbi:hypothetical protein FF38_10031 [Lucilia cuprina]|uniref:Uncharacterized protein n=1 Tax=Lucilia cuprina TaxID=7375 RepID=A0A0L0C5A1_LUCCU|nr:hypothetical protein FF38_10031 [Lucilia cuprina]
MMMTLKKILETKTISAVVIKWLIVEKAQNHHRDRNKQIRRLKGDVLLLQLLVVVLAASVVELMSDVMMLLLLLLLQLLEKGIMESIINLAGATVDVVVGVVVVKIISAAVAAFVYAVAVVFDVVVVGETLNHVLSHVELQVHSRRHWHKSNPEDRLVFVLFVVPLRPEPFEEPFAVAAAVIVGFAAVAAAAGSDQLDLWLAWHSKWWLFVAAFVEPVSLWLYVAQPNVDVAADTVAVGVVAAAVDDDAVVDAAAADDDVVAAAVHEPAFAAPCTAPVRPKIVSTAMSAVSRDPSGILLNSPPPHVNASGTGTARAPHRHPRSDFLNRPPISQSGY